MQEIKTVTFATNCWERDWKHILLDPLYLSQKQIGNNCFPFAEKLLIINDVNDLPAVCRAAQKKVDEGVLSRYVVADEIAHEVLPFFEFKREDLVPGPYAFRYNPADPSVNADFIYYNAMGPLSSIYLCQSDYLLYLNGDVRVDEPIEWIDQAIQIMENDPQIKVSNLTWNYRYEEARRESFALVNGLFYLAAQGFSDHMFLVQRTDFCAPIYREVRMDSHHYSCGDIFEKRAFSAMKNRGWMRLIYGKGSYIHEHL